MPRGGDRRRRRERSSDDAASLRRVDFLVDDADFDRAVDAARDCLVLGSESVVQCFTLVVRCSCEGPLVQDADSSLRTHHGYFGVGPSEYGSGSQCSRVHRDVGAAVDLSSDDGDAGGDRCLGEGVK